MSTFWWCILNDYDGGACTKPSSLVAFCIISVLLLIGVVGAAMQKTWRQRLELLPVIVLLLGADWAAWATAFS